jgi:hypothetical protein
MAYAFLPDSDQKPTFLPVGTGCDGGYKTP